MLQRSIDMTKEVKCEIFIVESATEALKYIFLIHSKFQMITVTESHMDASKESIEKVGL